MRLIFIKKNLPNEIFNFLFLKNKVLKIIQFNYYLRSILFSRTKMTSTMKIAHCSQLPRIQTRGLVNKFVNAISKKISQHLYDATLIGNTMENVYATTDQKSRYETVKASMVSVDYVGDFTFDLMFRMMNIREHVDERTAMEIAGFVQFYLPQRTFEKVPIKVNSVDAEGNPVTKVLEVKLYYAYEADAVQWLIKAFFNRTDLIDESHHQLDGITAPCDILNKLKDKNQVIETFFFGNDVNANIHNHLTFQSEMMRIRFPTEFDIFTECDDMIDGYPVFTCCGIFSMYIERFADTFTYCS
jgi:hypothetical protein